MRAARVHTFGEPLRVDELAPPAPASGEVLVQLSHAGVNPLDIRLRDGGAGRVPLPFVPGCDGAGSTEDGPVVVYGHGIGLRRQGTYAELVAVPRAAVVPLPDGVAAAAAAGLGVAAVTAWGIVHGSAAITGADRVLVLGATGGVGMLVTQLAAATGATVLAQTSSGDGAELLPDLGAEHVLAADAAGLAGAAKPLEPTVVVDPLGGEFTGAALGAMRPRGRLVLYGTAAGSAGELDFGMLYRKAVTLRGYAVFNTTAEDAAHALRGCLAALADGTLRTHIDDVLPLTEVNQAHDRLLARRVTGKLLLAP